MADVFKVADFFIETAGEESDMTNLKLNKMLYFAQGVHLARTGKPLFNSPIEAWKFGPVVPEIYRRFNICQNNPIGMTKADIDGFFDETETSTLLDVLREYGKFSASYLVSETHKPHSPWSSTAPNNQIPYDTMRDYFLSCQNVRTFTDALKDANIPVVNGRRDDTGTLVLPKEEDDDWGDFDEV